MKVVTAEVAAGLIQDGWTVTATGFGGFGHAEAVSEAVEQRFLSEGRPRDLTLLFAASNGDRKTRGMNHFAQEGLVKRVIAGGWRGTPRLGALAASDRIEAYIWPQGVVAQLYRAIAAGHPGVTTPVGLHTFVDPRYDGGRLNSRTKAALVELVTRGDREYLFFPAMPVDCAIIRGTTADERGNITTEHEAFHQDILAMAQSARNSGGIVIAQVKRLAKAGTLDPNAVRVPGILVDYVVIVERPDQHWVSFGEESNASYTGEYRLADQTFQPAPFDIRKVIQRRAFLELAKHHDAVINLGIGIPAGIGKVAWEEGKDDFTLTLESGPVGGIPAEDLSFGAAINPDAILDQAAQFDLYGGGGLDMAFLGMAELDVQGNVNVSRFGNQIIGVGGFIDIAQSAKQVIFMGTMTTGGRKVDIGNGQMSIVSQGSIQKIVPQVQHLSFNGVYAARLGRKVLYVTERAVFAMHDDGLTVTEIAPGIDLQKDVLEQVPDGVGVAADLCQMDARIFCASPMRPNS